MVTEKIAGKAPGIIVALDGITEHFALHLANGIGEIPGIWGFKVNDLLVRYGTDIVYKLSKFGKIMADPKFFDIPNTVANGVSRLVESGATIITVHAMGGEEMMTAAVETARKGKASIAAITVLTSMSEQDHAMLMNCDIEVSTILLMEHAKKCGVTHAVSAGDFAHHAKSAELASIVPGIRFDSGATIEHDDQKLVTRKFNEFIDYVVVGRPIINDVNPVSAAYRIRDEIQDAYCDPRK